MLPRYGLLIGSIVVLLLAMFFAASALHITILENPMPYLRARSVVVGVVGVLLLIADVFLPVPSSVVMVAHGAVFGVVTGSILSLIGSTAAAVTGFAVGRAGNGAIRRFVTPEEHDRAGAMLRRWGVYAIVISRPIPILAETVAILAGSSPLTWRQVFVGGAVGSIVPSVVYAWAGAHAAKISDQVIVFLGVMLITFVLWMIAKRRTQANEI